MKTIFISGILLLSNAVSAYESRPIYRSFSGEDYLFSREATEGPKSDYFPEEARFALIAENAPGLTPLYRCRLKSKKLGHFLSTNPTCEGQIVESALGNIATTPSNELAPLIRYVNIETNAHVSVIAGADEANFKTWKREGIQGYVIALNLPVVTLTPDDGKKYFGFYAGAMDGVGTKNYIPELANVSNLIFIKSKNFEEKLIECEQLGIKAVITFDWLFFDENFHLKENHEESFKAIVPVLQRHISTIAAFYGQDEPYQNGMSRKLSVAEIYNAQETMGRVLKSHFPNTPIGVILTTKELRESRPLFPSFDWFGFDCYSGSMKCEGKTVEWYYEHLNSLVNAMVEKDQKPRFLISVPQAGHPVKDGEKSGEKDIMAQVPQYREIVKQRDNIKVVMPFIWQSFNDGSSNWIGAREKPLVKSAYERFYIDFLNSTL